MTGGGRREIGIGGLGRVEGEATVHLRLRDGGVEHARLAVYEPPRFFEAFLRGRGYTEPPDLTSRVCGICPVAYQMSACQALEDACGTLVDPQVAALRRLMYCGEWIESHTLHVHLLHAPDFLGCDNLFDVAHRHRAAIERGLRLKHVGNSVVELLGGRAVHPVNVRLGGFHRVPSTDELRPLAAQLRRALDDAAEAVRWVAGFDFPDADCDHDLLALVSSGTYAIETGVPAVMDAPGLHGLPGDCDRSLPVRTFALRDFRDHVDEHQVPYSTALHARLDGRRYLTGPLARFALSGRWLTPAAAQAARTAGLGDPAAGYVCRNPGLSIVVRAVEVLYAVEEALRIIAAYEPPGRPCADVVPRAATGHGATEAPRGLLYHRYRLDCAGTVAEADLVPPTSQNQAAIEEDVRRAVDRRLRGGAATDVELASLCERTVRNHDPCISCSAHFLDLTVDRV
ncbi:Ni/Fe hydrogenase subunit alpha [Streptomyces sp. NPDC021224]|uniref:Ni/Fe hydrogenase subunit alpha n=1 Tax=unclassified Streptomyces TaxID=2593676 RepID=UPI0037A35E74